MTKPLRAWRHERLISIEELALKAGVSTKTIVETELGRSQPRFATIRKLAKALDVDPQQVDEFVAVMRAADNN